MKKRGKRYWILLLTVLLFALPMQVSAAKASIKLNASKATLTMGSSKTLKATVKGKSSKVTWKSSKASVASVSQTGKVTAKKAGKATITAKANGKTAKCVVTVKKPAYTKAYAQWLKKHPSKTSSRYQDASYNPSNKSFVNQFVLYDLDKNGVPELITFTNVNFRWQIIRIYTYKSGAVKQIKFADGSKELDNCAVANGGYCFSICKHGHIHNEYAGSFMSQSDIYEMKSGKLCKYLSRMTPGAFMGGRTVCMKGDAEITAGEFAELTSGCQGVKLTGYKNTKTNQNKMNAGTCKVSK